MFRTSGVVVEKKLKFKKTICIFEYAFIIAQVEIIL